MISARAIVPCRGGRRIVPAFLRRDEGKRASAAQAETGIHGVSRRHATTAAATAAPAAGLGRILRVSDEVADAVATNRPVVALESTIYTHGALGPDLGLEDIVRRHGAVPAVCGVLDGVPTVGLAPAEVERMVVEGAVKASRRDLAFLVGTGMIGGQEHKKLHGGTTIAGTMILARLAGVRVFGTGGLGGVHRGGQDSLDVSADLTELGRTRVAVVSSGCKGFLDIPRTLEVLETQGVLVATFADGCPEGDGVDFPAFWARESGCRSPAVVRDGAQAAAIIFAQERLGVESGLLFANPIPREHAIPRADMDAAIGTAVREADELGYAGSRNTPYILRRIRELTQGRSVPANLALVQANVARAARVAVELAKLLGAESAEAHNFHSVQVPRLRETVKEAGGASEQLDNKSKVDVLVAGSVALDLSCDYLGHDMTSGAGREVAPALHTSNPSTISQSVGGVGHNVALAVHRVSGDGKVQLCSMVGTDIAGETILSSLRTSGLDTSCIRQLGGETRTAQYVAVNDADKNLVVAMADMDIFTTQPPFTSCFSPSSWASSALAATKPSWLVVDANWTAPDIRAWMHAARAHGARVAFEPVSTAKAARLFAPPSSNHGHDHSSSSSSSSSSNSNSDAGGLGVFPHPTVDLLSPNAHELAALHAAATAHGYLDDPRWFAVIDALGITSASGARARFDRLAGRDLADAGVPQQSVRLLPYAPAVAAKLGARGVLLTLLLSAGDPRLHDPACAPYLLARAPPGSGAGRAGGVYMRLFPPPRVLDRDIVSVNGAGDTFLAVLVVGLAQGGRPDCLVDVAQRAAALTLRSRQSVGEDLVALRGELRDAAARS